MAQNKYFLYVSSLLPNLSTVYCVVKIQKELLQHLDSQRSHYSVGERRLLNMPELKRIRGQIGDTVQCPVVQIIRSKEEKISR